MNTILLKFKSEKARSSCKKSKEGINRMRPRWREGEMNEGDFFNAEVVKGRVSLLKKEKMWWGKKKGKLGSGGKMEMRLQRMKGKLPK